jgi:hypothetical protein
MPDPALDPDLLPILPKNTPNTILKDIETDEHKTHTLRSSFLGFSLGKLTARKRSHFCIVDRDHPIPMCRNLSVEKWTLEDMLDRWTMLTPGESLSFLPSELEA